MPLNEGLQKFIDSKGEDIAGLEQPNTPADVISPTIASRETSVNKQDEGTQLSLVSTEETPEQKQAREAKTAEDASKKAQEKADDEKARKEAISKWNLVDLNALTEARTEAKEAKRQAQELANWRQQIEPILKTLTPAADKITNPYQPGTENHALWEAATPEQKEASWKWENQQKTLASIVDWKNQQEQQAKTNQQIQQVTNWALGEQTKFEKTQPAYKDAYSFAAQARHSELEALGYSDAAQREQMISADQAGIVMEAARRTMAGTPTNPAELIYNYAIAKGFKVTNTDKSTQTVTKIKAGQEASGGLNGGQAPKTEITMEDLANMPTKTAKQKESFRKAYEKLTGHRIS